MENKGRLLGWENDYEIYSDGKVFSFKKNRFLRPTIQGMYFRVTLSKNKYIEKWSIHRLVATVFLQNIENKPCVNHKDGDKLNNNVKNLEWVTYSENELHSFNVLGKKIKHSEETKAKIRSKAMGRDMTKAWQKAADNKRGKPAHNRVSVTSIDASGNEKTYTSLSEAAKDVSGHVCAFGALKRGRLKTYKNYKWKFNN